MLIVIPIFLNTPFIRTVFYFYFVGDNAYLYLVYQPVLCLLFCSTKIFKAVPNKKFDAMVHGCFHADARFYDYLGDLKSEV
jgi:hypothetical protein